MRTIATDAKSVPTWPQGKPTVNPTNPESEFAMQQTQPTSPLDCVCPHKSESLSRRRARADAEEGVPARFRIHAIPETEMHDPERDIRDIPLSQLELSPGNVRKTPADASAFTELKASIAAHGLLENLIARSIGPGPDGFGAWT